MHLNWLSSDRKADPASTGHAAAGAQPFELSVIDLVTLDGRRLAWAATNGRRTSDWLNAGEALELRGAQAVELADPDAPPPPLPDHAPEESLLSSEVLFVIPPPLPANRHLRLHRRRVQVRMVLRGFHVSGQAHVRPGAEVGTHLFRGGRRFVPLTDVELSSVSDPELSWTLPVLIVNSMHVEELLDREPMRRAPTAPVAGPEEPSDFFEPVQPVAQAEPTRADEPPMPVPTDEPAPYVAAVAPDAPDAPDAVEAPIPLAGLDGSRHSVLMLCLELLLSEDIIDIAEFQEKRARLGPA